MLYLLDSNDPFNAPSDRGLTSALYGGSSEVRLLQEIILGIGGWRLIDALGLGIEICHLNEGHAAFVVIERARHFMAQHGVTFREALRATRAGNVFTTHTAVPAGFDTFPADEIRTLRPYFEDYVRGLGLSWPELLALGRRDPLDENEPFNMAWLAMRGCSWVNGVSQLHGVISRRLFAGLFPRWPEQEVPVDHVTNGVHVPSWDSPWTDALWTRAAGKERWRGDVSALTANILRLPDDGFVAPAHSASAKTSCGTRADRLSRKLARHGSLHEAVTNRPRRAASRRADAGLRPPLRHLQAAEPSAHRSGAPAAAADRSTAARSAHRRRQGASARRGGQGADPAMGAVRGPARGAGPRRLPRRLRHAAGHRARPGCRRLDQHAPASVGGERHQRHEGAGERGAQPLDAGRLVVGSLRPRLWLGARRPRRAERRRRRRRPPSSTRCSKTRSCRRSTTAMPTGCRGDGLRGCGRAWRRSRRASAASRMLQEYVAWAYLPGAASYTRRADTGRGRRTGDRALGADTSNSTGAASASARSQQPASNGRLTFSVPVWLGAIRPDDVRVELYADARGLAAVGGAADDTGGGHPGRGQRLRSTASASRATGPRRTSPLGSCRAHPDARVPIEVPLIAWQR